MSHPFARAGRVVGLSLALLGVPTLASAQASTKSAAASVAAPATPEALAERYIAAIRQGDWNSVAALMHPRALATLRAFIGAMAGKPGADQFLNQMFGGSAEAIAKISDQEMFSRFLGASLGANPEMAQVLSTAKGAVLGHINEGAETAHVLYRMHMSFNGVDVAKVDVLSAAKDGAGWRALLTADIENMIAQIKASSE